MSANQIATKWINLCACTISDYTSAPTGIDRNNYIIIDRTFIAIKWITNII